MRVHSFILVLILLFSTSACKIGLGAKLDSLYWYEEYGIPSKKEIIDTQYIPNLIEALTDENRRVVIYSAKALGEMGSKAEESLPALSEVALSDRHPIVIYHAIETITLVGKEHPTTISTLSELLLNRRSVKIRVRAAKALSTLGPSAAPAIPALTEGLKSLNYNIRLHCALTLAHIGPKAKSALPALEDLLQRDRRTVVRNAVNEAIRRITYDERQNENLKTAQPGA